MITSPSLISGRLVACEEKNLLLQRISQKELTLLVDRRVTAPIQCGSLVVQAAGEKRLSVRYNPQNSDFSAIIEAVKKSRLRYPGCHYR